MERSAAKESIFVEILNYSTRRIMQRLSPDWYPAPSHWNAQQRQKKKSLRDRILKHVLPNLRASSLGKVRGELNSLVAVLEPLEHSQAAQSLSQHMRRAVEACAETSTNPGRSSLEFQLGSSLSELSEAGRKAVCQIDKIARYLRMSGDLVKLAAGSSRQMFQSLMVEHICSPQPRKPKGAHEMCSVHAEIQLILHYEMHPCHPGPRAMGCSKSACYLCDLFINRHGRYRISFAHRRLYPKWTIPNAFFLDSEQVGSIRRIIRDMTQEMERLISLGRSSALSAPIESRACLPLSSDLVSEVGVVEKSEDRKNVLAESGSSTTLTLILRGLSQSVLHLGDESLPFYEELPATCDAVQLTLGTMTVFFDFEEAPGPFLSVKTAAGLATTGIRTFCVDNLSTRDDVALPCDEDDRVRFRLRVSASIFEITLGRRLVK